MLQLLNPASGPLDQSRRSPWHVAGTDVSACRTPSDVLEKARLAHWNIHKLVQTGVEIRDNKARTVVNRDTVMLVRDGANNTTQYMSTVGKDYGIHQNEAQLDLLEALTGMTGADGYAAAGQLNGGLNTFVTMTLPETIRVAGNDDVALNLVVFNSHDGKRAFRVMLVPFRIFCANQLSVAIKGAVSEVVIRHTRNSKIDVEEIRSKLGLVYDYAEQFERHAQRMVEAELTDTEFRAIVEQVWPLESNPPSGTLANHRRRNSELVKLWSTADTQDNIRGTRWGALQAITEYLDWFAPASTHDLRANRVLVGGAVAKNKQNAFDLLAI